MTKASIRRPSAYLRLPDEKSAGWFTGPPVFFELAWTLRAAYKTPNKRVLEILSAVFAMPGMTLTDAPLVADALTRALATGSEFADAVRSLSRFQCPAQRHNLCVQTGVSAVGC